MDRIGELWAYYSLLHMYSLYYTYDTLYSVNIQSVIFLFWCIRVHSLLYRPRAYACNWVAYMRLQMMNPWFCGFAYAAQDGFGSLVTYEASTP